jgi:hypothetical protein
MAGKVKTTDDLVSDVRSQLDELNNDSVNTNTDILPALNRAQDYAANTLARAYESPLLTNVLVTPASQETDIPSDCLEQRVEKVEVKIGQAYYPLTRIDYRDIGLYDTGQTANIPSFYYMIGNKYGTVPASTNVYPLRVWYLKDPLPLVLQQGRITRVNTTDNYILVDSIGEDLTTEADNLDSYVNLIDGSSGEVKCSMQIRSLSDNKITFKTSPTRTTVLGQTISTTLVDKDIAEDDYICVIKGTCIPLLKKPNSNFIIQYAVAELTRKLGGAADMEERVKQQLEKQVERSWVGREQSIRVTKANRYWGFPLKRYIRF